MGNQIVIRKAHLLQSCKDFFLANNLDPKRWAYDRHTGEEETDYLHGPLMFNADVNRPEDPDGYAAEIGVAGTTILLPPGRMVHIGYTAGHIDSISAVLPLDTISFDEMRSICRNIGVQFEHIGFKPVRKQDQMMEREFHARGGRRNQYGKWQLDYPVPIRLALEMKNFNRMATTSFTTVLAEPTPRHARPTYLVDVYISLESEVRSELSELLEARNLAVNGDRDKPLPLKVWFDDPDWRPANWQGKWLK